MSERQPSTRYWSFPEPDRQPLPHGIERANLKELAARPGRFEHHLVVLGRVGICQLELATASEPLYFAHANISDEYALALPTGDALFDAMPFRTFLSDRETGEDLGRLNHRTGDLVLHPHGYLHWPGRLRPPFDPPRFPGDERRTGLSLVYCAYQPQPPNPDRPLGISPGRADVEKAYGAAPPPFQLVDLFKDSAQVVGRIASSSLELLVEPAEVSAPLGGYLLILEGSAPAYAACDLLYFPPGTTLNLAEPPGERLIQRALWLSDAEFPAEPPPEIWRGTPEPDFATYEDMPPGSLPLELCGIRAELVDDQSVRLHIGGGAATVPRYWLARFLFRLGLHAYQIGYLETYGGFFYDDQGGYRLGLRGVGEQSIAPEQIRTVVEALYRAVAPAGYVERL